MSSKTDYLRQVLNEEANKVSALIELLLDYTSSSRFRLWHELRRTNNFVDLDETRVRLLNAAIDNVGCLWSLTAAASLKLQTLVSNLEQASLRFPLDHSAFLAKLSAADIDMSGIRCTDDVRNQLSLNGNQSASIDALIILIPGIVKESESYLQALEQGNDSVANALKCRAIVNKVRSGVHGGMVLI